MVKYSDNNSKHAESASGFACFLLQIICVKKITHTDMQYAQKWIYKIIKMHGIVLGSGFLVKIC